ncbi:MAG: hypothetical protein AB1649_33915 [Chloroflexota bacterium]
MSIRPLDLLDLPYVTRYRNDTLTLDSARALTRGHPLGAVGFLSYFNPARHLYAALAKENGSSILGGVIHTRGETFARLLYLTPSSELKHPELPALLDHLSIEAGKWGAFHVLAEVDETSDAFILLRKAGFSVYAWQRMWDVSNLTEAGQRSTWRRARSVDLPAIQSLYYQIAPALLHAIEPAPNQPRGLVSGDGIKCYASMMSGVAGIVFTPLIHPEISKVSDRLAGLVNSVQDHRSRSVYFCVRSYQAWLEPVLEDLGAQATSRQAVMVKHLTHLLRDEQTVPAVPSAASIQPSRVTRMDKHSSG